MQPNPQELGRSGLQVANGQVFANPATAWPNCCDKRGHGTLVNNLVRG